MSQFRLYLFSEPSGERECVVISDENPNEVRKEYEEGNRQLDSCLEIEGNATCFPTDRELVHKLY